MQHLEPGQEVGLTQLLDALEHLHENSQAMPTDTPTPQKARSTPTAIIVTYSLPGADVEHVLSSNTGTEAA